MFALALATGIFSYLIFSLGVLRWLYAFPIVFLTSIFWGGFIWWQQRSLKNNLDIFLKFIFLKKAKLFLLVFCLVILQILVNFVGVLGPEIAFDATWYHLTLPKLFLQWHYLRHIPGGVLYYSDMPKLFEMIYIPGLAILGETGPKFIHFFFGIVCCIGLYSLARKFLNPTLSIFAVAIFYSNLVVGWESISAYIDLGRTFFAILSFLAFFTWFETKQTTWIITTAIMLGLGITAKFLAVADLGIFIPVIIWMDWRNIQKLFINLFVFIFVAVVIPMPWWIFSYLQTGNPFYPFFTTLYPFAHNFSVSPVQFITTIWVEFTHSVDPINPMYIAFLPFLFLFKKWDMKKVVLGVMGILSIVVWYVSPQTGGGRFLLPYLPVLSILVVFVYQSFGKRLQKIFIIMLFVSLFSSIFYRGIANAKFVPVILGKETKAAFLTQHLNFSFGDWYDIDGHMARTIKPTDTVLLYGYHNLYYVDFPYIHYTWVKTGDSFNYIATDGSALPRRFENWQLVYQNPITHLHLYRDGGKVWTY